MVLRKWNVRNILLVAFYMREACTILGPFRLGANLRNGSSSTFLAVGSWQFKR
jgi:hypothetical protein